MGPKLLAHHPPLYNHAIDQVFHHPDRLTSPASTIMAIIVDTVREGRYFIIRKSVVASREEVYIYPKISRGVDTKPFSDYCLGFVGPN